MGFFAVAVAIAVAVGDPEAEGTTVPVGGGVVFVGGIVLDGLAVGVFAIFGVAVGTDAAAAAAAMVDEAIDGLEWRVGLWNFQGSFLVNTDRPLTPAQ